jgi:uroporphyrinogen decarboxylase
MGSHTFRAKLLQHFRTNDLEYVKKKLGIDTREFSPFWNPPKSFRERAVFTPELLAPWGITVASDTYEDEWGVRRKLGADKNLGYVVKHPLADAESLSECAFPDPEEPTRFDALTEGVKRFKENYAIVAHIWAMFAMAWHLRGFNRLMVDFYANPKLVDDLMHRLLDYDLKIGRICVELGADMIMIGGDVATQTGMMLSPNLWRKYLKYEADLIHGLKAKGNIPVIRHTDGDCTAVIKDFIDIGVDVLNPVQPDCLNPAELKKTYGDRIALYGGVSVQETLPFGTIDDVTKEVELRIRTCAPGGGFIIAPSNDMMEDIKIENALALYETAIRRGVYPIDF